MNPKDFQVGQVSVLLWPVRSAQFPWAHLLLYESEKRTVFEKLLNIVVIIFIDILLSTVKLCKQEHGKIRTERIPEKTPSKIRARRDTFRLMFLSNDTSECRDHVAQRFKS